MSPGSCRYMAPTTNPTAPVPRPRSRYRRRPGFFLSAPSQSCPGIDCTRRTARAIPGAPPCCAALGVSVRVRFGAGGLARRERLLDDFLRDRRRRLLVMREVLLERATARGDRAQVGRVLQHLRHRHLRLDHLAIALAVHPEHFAATRVQIADYVAHAFIGTRNFDRDDRFENDRS